MTTPPPPGEPIDWAPRTTPLGPPAAPVTGPAAYPPAYGPPSPPRPAYDRRLIIGLSIGVAVAVLISTGLIVSALALRGHSAPATSTAAAAPVISNIPRPNAACTPAADRKLGMNDDLSSILFIGYIDGKQEEMLVGRALSLGIAGHKVETVWYCPLRSQWH